MQRVIFRDLGQMDYKLAWDYQEELLRQNLFIKSQIRQQQEAIGVTLVAGPRGPSGLQAEPDLPSSTERNDHSSLSTNHYLLFVEHPPVYTLGKSGHLENILIGEQEARKKGNRLL